jgi:hypothetical protein
MFSSTVRRAADTVGEATPVDPAELVPLAELAAEGFGYGSPFVTTPRDAVDALAAELGGQATLDNIGRQCVTRDVARRLFTERADAEQRQREAQERNEAQLAELAAVNAPRRGVSADLIPEGVTPTAALLQAAKDDQPRRRSVLEEALDNDDALTYHPIREES